MNDIVPTHNLPPGQSSSCRFTTSADALMQVAQAALQISNKSGADYGRWHNNYQSQVARVGYLACWRDGLMVTMKVGADSLAAQEKIRAAFTECQRLLVAQRNTLTNLTSTDSASAGEDPSVSELKQQIAESEATISRIGEALTQESFRFSQVMNTWDEIALHIANLYSLPPSALWQTKEYMSPSMLTPADYDFIDGDTDFDN